MENIVITYKASKSNLGGYKPCTFVNGKFHYNTERNKKTERGALSAAKRVAEDIAAYYNSQNFFKQIYNVTIKEI